jgi:hypothetical protein
MCGWLLLALAPAQLIWSYGLGYRPIRAPLYKLLRSRMSWYLSGRYTRSGTQRSWPWACRWPSISLPPMAFKGTCVQLRVWTRHGAVRPEPSRCVGLMWLTMYRYRDQLAQSIMPAKTTSLFLERLQPDDEFPSSGQSGVLSFVASTADDLAHV